ncbi:MAG TPA: hypothetical protein VK784_02380, partial [Pseudonocardiaceae bacterium]|nr:hypothetical protein [Pseudonocardiaceae bacterium]
MIGHQHLPTPPAPAARPSRRLRPTVTACTAVLVLVLASCSQLISSQPTNANSVTTDEPAALTRFYTQKLVWSSC